MIARRPRSPASRRRGVVLILVLSMLGLLAVIGVSFAAFSGQARSAARVYSQKLNRPQADDLIEFAVRQLVNDTTNPMSALYGHGLKRDMYGNDAATNGFYDRNPDGSFPRIAGAPTVVYDPDADTVRRGPAEWTITTNIPSHVGYNFNGWILTIPGTGGNVAQTFEVINGDATGPFYILEITGSHTPLAGLQGVGLTGPFNGAVFSLDGRYRRAFNGTGMAALTAAVDAAMTAGNDPGNRNPGQFANFRVSGGLLNGDAVYTPRPFDVNQLPVDEDYDAPDLENWFLAAQSADGRTIIPSFHRPGILTIDSGTGLSDMEILHPSQFPAGSETTADYRRAVRAISKILTPRPVDHPTAGFPDLIPDADGFIEYPVDNDGDGIGDSVWLDLGYPVQRNADGTLYKPLFSFMAVGLNGRLPLNTAGNLNSRLLVDDPTTPTVDEAGLPLFDHASHLGYSPSEINPSYALQNAFDGSGGVLADGDKPLHQQFDNASFPIGSGIGHIPVSLSQLRSLLTGTRINPDNDRGEVNGVLVDGILQRFHNNVVDDADVVVADPGGELVDRSLSRSVPGRWGEPDAVPPAMRRFPVADAITPAVDRALNFSPSLVGGVIMPNPARPGQSPYPDGQYLIDGIDNNLDTVDLFPPWAAAQGPEAGLLNNDGSFIRSDFHDAANMPSMASERFRRFVSPIDPTGIGRVARYNQAPGVTPPPDPPELRPFDIGPDGRGRVSFMHYFRPPGVPLDADDDSTVDLDSSGVPVDVTRNRLIPNTSGGTDASYDIALNRHNQYRGFQAYLFPGGGNGHLMAAMPYDMSNVGAGLQPRDAATGEAVPPTNLFAPGGGYVGTFSDFKNADPFGRLTRDPGGLFAHLGTQAAFATTAATAVHSYPLGSPLFNDPNEMNLYWPDVNDSPFGPTDLEWLYRYGDIDGASLESRLEDLAPISFVHAADAQTRRRLFSVETWDRIDYAFANDNTADRNNIIVPAALSRLDTAQFPPAANARFAATESASFETLDRANPSVSHGGRRINLNHPFPHSYDPYEPIRQKWISETYETLKTILPPHAIDTPQELAKLGQYVVNIVDFRDPDNAITIWANPDVCHLPARHVNGYDLPPSIHIAYRADGTIDPNYDPNGPRLIHYGMEYQPVALNEVLGFQFSFAEDTGGGTFVNSRANRLFIEMVNMLSRPGQPANDANDLDLQGWDFVLVKEDPNAAYTAGTPHFHPVFTRPDPITGQIPANTLDDDERPVARDDPSVTPLAEQGKAVLVGTGEEPDRSTNDLDDYQNSYRASGLPAAHRVPAIQNNGDPTHFVLTGTRTNSVEVPAINEVGRPVTDPSDPADPTPPKQEFPHNDWALIPDIADPAFNTPAGGPGLFYWLYLRRPANPLLPPGPGNPLVVVDSIRFPFSSSNGIGEEVSGNAGQVTPPTQSIYSIQRPQPFRGGQLVPDPEDPAQPLFLYGSTEQARPAEPNNTDPENGYRTYFAVRPGSTNNDRRLTTSNIYQTIGDQNRTARFATGGPREAYDYFPFNDRDFMSVAELLLVPASPPGLFTKQFAERPPSLLVTPDAQAFADIPPADVANTPLWPSSLPADPDIDPVPGASPPMPHTRVRTYPYLAHEFYYTSDPSTPAGPHIVGGPTGAGWHRMLELFEVPSPVLDAIGPVAQGLNFDWYRQDRRPGQINMNLILDEEVFFGLIDDPRLLDATNLQRSLIANPADPFDPTELPQIVTAVDEFGSPLLHHPMINRGFTVLSTLNDGSQLADLAGTPTSANFPWMRMKRSFADFLKQRHGGSGFLFAYGDGVTGTMGLGPAPLGSKVARDLPYRSLSYYDIQRTLMRPATMEPSEFTNPDTLDLTLRVRDPGLKDSQYDVNEGVDVLLDPGYVYEPPDSAGITDPSEIQLFYPNPPRVAPSGIKPIVPPIPPRRWFQIPDWTDLADPIATASNASVESQQVTDYSPITNANTGLSPVAPQPLWGDYPGLFPLWTFPGTGEEMWDPYTGSSPQLGGSLVGGTFPLPGQPLPLVIASPSGNGQAVVNQDMRRHPYYRTEMLQKVSNLTTPRTHQYAVWVTVGLFEVVRPGDRAQFIPDELGPELGSASGGNVRYRSFFVLDRSRATGFNPLRPGDYRDIIVYSRRIE